MRAAPPDCPIPGATGMSAPEGTGVNGVHLTNASVSFNIIAWAEEQLRRVAGRGSCEIPRKSKRIATTTTIQLWDVRLKGVGKRHTLTTGARIGKGSKLKFSVCTETLVFVAALTMRARCNSTTCRMTGTSIEYVQAQERSIIIHGRRGKRRLAITNPSVSKFCVRTVIG